MFGILGEDRSDFGTLKVLTRRIRNDESLPIMGKGYQGCGQLLKKGTVELRLLSELGCNKFVICYDSDGKDPKQRYSEVLERVVAPAGLATKCCIAIPVEELEAWLLADIEAVTNIWTGWRPASIANPERIKSPKEHLEGLSRD